MGNPREETKSVKSPMRYNKFIHMSARMLSVVFLVLLAVALFNSFQMLDVLLLLVAFMFWSNEADSQDIRLRTEQGLLAVAYYSKHLSQDSDIKELIGALKGMESGGSKIEVTVDDHRSSESSPIEQEVTDEQTKS